MSFFERYALCCREKGIAPVGQAAADAIGCNKSTISAFAKNGNTPKGDIIAGAARMLDVTADYLLGLSDSPFPLVSEGSLEKDEMELVARYRRLNARGKDALQAAMRGMETSDNFIDEK